MYTPANPSFTGVRGCYLHGCVMQRFRADMPEQSVLTKISLLLEEQSGQGLHCLPFSILSAFFEAFASVSQIFMHSQGSSLRAI